MAADGDMRGGRTWVGRGDVARGTWRGWDVDWGGGGRAGRVRTAETMMRGTPAAAHCRRRRRRKPVTLPSHVTRSRYAAA